MRTGASPGQVAPEEVARVIEGLNGIHRVVRTRAIRQVHFFHALRGIPLPSAACASFSRAMNVSGA